jgi:hypothetical protein
LLRGSNPEVEPTKVVSAKFKGEIMVLKRYKPKIEKQVMKQALIFGVAIYANAKVISLDKFYLKTNKVKGDPNAKG